MSTLGTPNAIYFWQVGDSCHQNGGCKMAMTVEKYGHLHFRHRHAFQRTDFDICNIVLLINRAWKKSFEIRDKNLEAKMHIHNTGSTTTEIVEPVLCICILASKSLSVTDVKGFDYCTKIPSDSSKTMKENMWEGKVIPRLPVCKFRGGWFQV